MSNGFLIKSPTITKFVTYVGIFWILNGSCILSTVFLNLSIVSLLSSPIHCMILAIADVSDIVNAPQFSWAHVSILMSAVRLSGLPIPVTRMVVVPNFFAISNA